MTCVVCNIKHVEEAENTLKTRCSGHECNIRNVNNNQVSNHYGSYNYTMEDHVVCAVDKQEIKTRDCDWKKLG